MQTVKFHRASSLSLLLFVLPWIAACDSSGGGGGAKRVTIRYAGDDAAYGISIRTGTMVAATPSSGPDENALCTISATAAAAGCTSSIATSVDGLDLALYGCRAEAGDELFDCQLSPALEESLRADATVRAGCGCQPCPANPSITVCDDGSVDCQEAHLESVTAARPRPDAVATTQRNTGETTCSTCCETDFFEDQIGTVVSDEPISEITVEVTFDEECRSDVNGDAECEIYDPEDHWGRVAAFGSTLVQRLCLVAHDPGEGPLSVPAVSCRGLIIETKVTHALGRDFAPLSSMPTVVFE